MSHIEITLLALFTLAAGVAILSKRLDMPYTIALVVTGLIMGSLHLFEAPPLSKELLFLVILPGLLFEAAYHMDIKEFWHARLSIFTLAIPGLLVAIILTGAAVWGLVEATGLGEITFVEALVFGALISATDPISVLAIFKTLGVNKKLYTLVEGESLFNDGTAVVVFSILLDYALGHSTSTSEVATTFIQVTLGASLIGVGIGGFTSWLTKTIEDPVIEITLTALSAYGSFIIAEYFHLSGVIACVVAGMMMGNWGARFGMGPSTKIAVATFWDYTTFILNSLVFLLVGFEIEFIELLEHAPLIILTWGIVLVGRAIVVFGKRTLLNGLKIGEPMPFSWAIVLTWGGLRGSLSMVLALALPLEFGHRELIIHLTFGVVLLSLIIQGLSAKSVIRGLGLAGAGKEWILYEIKLAKLRSARAALSEIVKLKKQDPWVFEVHSEIQHDYEERVETLEKEMKNMHFERDDLRKAEEVTLSRHLLTIEKVALHAAVRDGTISSEVEHKLSAEVDERLIALEVEHGHG